VVLSFGRLGVLAALVVGGALASPVDASTTSARSCGSLSAAADTVRVYAIRGVTCRKAVSVARVALRTAPPKPWHCLTGTGQIYRGKPLSIACGYGSRGPVLRRAHAFAVVQTHAG
jgi:hypothetical protein